MPAWVVQGYEEYSKRMPPECRLRLHEVTAGKRHKGADLQRLVDQEGARMLALLPPRCQVLALERGGQQLDTLGLAAELERQLATGQDWTILIGGPEGLAPACLARADKQWSLSNLTLAHPLVLAEQLSRAWSVIKQLPYHR